MSNAALISSRTRRALFPPSVIAIKSFSMPRRAVSVLWPRLYANETWHANCFHLNVSAADQQLLCLGSWTSTAGSTPGGSYWEPQGPGLTSWLVVLWLFFEGPGHSARFKTEIYSLLKDRQKNISKFKVQILLTLGVRLLWCTLMLEWV